MNFSKRKRGGAGDGVLSLSGKILLTMCALAAGCLHAAVEQTSLRREAEQTSSRWMKAWEAAGAVSSPHDAGVVKAELGAMAAVNNKGAVLRGWCEMESTPWVAIYCGVMEAYREALHGSRERHLALLRDASELATALDEWDQARFSRPALRALVAGDWRMSQNFERLTTWIAEDELNRMPAAIHFFRDGSCGRVVADGIFDAASTAAFLDLVMTNAHKFAPGERLKVLAGVAPLLVATKWAEVLGREVDAMEGTWTNLPFAALLDVSRIDAGLGHFARADARIARAEQMIEAGETGDCPAPWASLAEAKIAAGRSRGEIIAAFETGIARAGERPGYLKDVAEALTWAAWAQFDGDGVNE